MTTPLVLFHGGCSDGFAAAWVSRLQMKAAEFVPVSHGEPPPDVTGRLVYILDFSYKRPILQEMIRRARMIVLLDHHQSAQQELEGMLSDVSLISTGQPGLYGTFDMGHSGAMLAWMHFFPGQLPPILVQYVEDRDLWRFNLSRSREVAAALRSYPFDFDLWDSWHFEYGRPGHIKPGVIDRLVNDGTAILRYQNEQIERILASAYDMSFDDGKERYGIRAVNSPVLQSELAGKLAEGRPFGACWYDDGYVRHWSLRSTKEGVDVSLVARRMGGGGHPHSAGFEEPSCTTEHAPAPPKEK